MFIGWLERSFLAMISLNQTRMTHWMSPQDTVACITLGTAGQTKKDKTHKEQTPISRTMNNDGTTLPLTTHPMTHIVAVPMPTVLLCQTWKPKSFDSKSPHAKRKIR